MTPPVVELTGVSKDYRSLRPLRVEQLIVRGGEHVALMGLDRPMAEVFVNLVTGAALPDSGTVKVFGRPTSAVTDSTDWLGVVDRFGIVSERAVLLDALTVLQNLTLPFTLEIEPPPHEAGQRAANLAQEVGLPESTWAKPLAALGATARARVQLARALALDPSVLLLEHVTADVGRQEVRSFAGCIRSAAARRGAAIVALTADEPFAAAVAQRVLVLEAATGRLKKRRRWLARRSW